MATRYSIRIWKDGAGHWCEIRDQHRRLVKKSWGPGSRAAARDDARRVVANLAAQQETAA